MATVGVNVIETAALGRPFQLGKLTPINTNFRVTASDSIEDKSSLLNIDSSLKLSLLGGLVNVRGAAKYLNNTKTSFRQQRLTLHYHSTCRFKELTMNHLAAENIIYPEVFYNDAATHVVTAVLYGADACFVFDREVSADEEIKTVEGEAKKHISMDLIIKTESVIESLNTAEMKCRDLLKDSPALTFTEFQNKILQMKQNCYKYKLRLMKRLGSLLPNIRGDVMKETELNDLLQEHDESPFRGRDLTEWLKERERESEIIKSVLRQLKDAGAQEEVNLDAVWMDLGDENLVCYTFTSLDWTDVLLPKQTTYLNPSTKGETDENHPDSEQKSWLSSNVMKKIRRNVEIFKKLSSKDHKPARFIVSSREMENNPGSCILLYEHGCDEAVCFIPPSKPVCPVTEEVRENTVVLKVPPLCPDTVELRLLYKLKQDSVWTSKPVMKNQNTVTLTDLRSETEYEIRWEAVGKLNYTTHGDVIRVTTE
ncbi:hypothetical protein M9458_050350, partial [Cirrhinus mrigala]